MAESNHKTSKLHAWLNHLWYGKSAVAKLLLPISFVFSAAARSRKNKQLKQQIKFRVPVVVIGNISVGGTGKTPMTIFLVEELTKIGLRVGVATRGYGGSLKSTTRVQQSHNAETVGDEPWLMYTRLDAPIVIGADRVNVIATLIDKYSCNIVVCDDGLQDYRFFHDVEICMVDGQRLYGNQHLLPAGPLRESIQRIDACDFVVVNSKSVPEISMDSMQICFDGLININNPEETKLLSDFVNDKVHAIAGIANPDKFFELLKQEGLSIVEHVFPDHARYNKQELSFDDGAPVIMTEKDAVKCLHLNIDNAWYLPVSAKLPDNFIARLQSKLSEKYG